MAIQAQFYPENPGFSMEFGNVGLNQFSTQQKLQEQQQLLMQLELQNLYQQQQNKRFRNDNDFVFSNSKNNISKVDHQSMTYGQNITAQVEKQRQEIDNYIKLQVKVQSYMSICKWVLFLLLLFNRIIFVFVRNVSTDILLFV